MNTVTEHDATLDRPETEDLANQTVAEVVENSESAAEAINEKETLLSFTTHDGVALKYRYWPAKSPNQGVRKTVVMFHRGHEHSGRMAHLVDELGLDDCDFFAWDARGHGESPGERGDSPSFGTSVRDVQTFMDHLAAQHQVDIEQTIVLAQSVGAVLASTWVHDYAPNIRALVLASPAFSIKLYVPFAIPGLRLLKQFKGYFFVNSYVKAKFLTHDPERIASFDNDPLIARPISVQMLLGLHDAAKRVVADAAAINVPTQLLISGDDWVVRRKPQQQFFERLSSDCKEQHILPGFYHDTLGELARPQALARIKRFVEQRFAEPRKTNDLLNADKSGYFCAEAESLAAPLPKGSLRARFWDFYRSTLAFTSRYSAGVKLGFDTGFDSGSTLDYVYRNKPTGTNKIGELIDQNYLNSVGWQGIRQRKVNLEELLAKAMDKLKNEQREVKLVDIAAGHGRYILAAIEQAEVKPQAVLLRDYSDINVRDGNALIEEKGLGEIVQFVKGDAFDKADLAALALKPNLAVVSGLYELFGDNTIVSGSLAGLSQGMEKGGYLIYTGQPWHPQLELIARALTSHREGQAWVMRRRSQAEMDQLVAAAGFKKIEQRIDEMGIFTVSIAQKVD
ncbi:bifunctional alpha/beta hydrolase/class I SAM-dependent methyltransferase [Motilimonas sp. E26]|uniref:bifunctional alpha/beta hydrolase/class I SAM-dependent methyltransferase n=1 Tax=Motilimonas sp. E26 TaxID=2865674 RepID=UPI001E48886A|nr:bifunctional alpha/beta hydrolase/class I SAM-dependent methyltransferase [Motilimonas sp. E26]MCE0557571.1 bifunctional alpha/beta hydrolase/class I SAM-dependent methyltransferase [Motilimonas sp. E26]